MLQNTLEYSVLIYRYFPNEESRGPQSREADWQAEIYLSGWKVPEIVRQLMTFFQINRDTAVDTGLR